MDICASPVPRLAASQKQFARTYIIFMLVLATQHSRTSWMRIILPHSGDIDEQTTVGINPPGINDVKRVRLIAYNVVWIDFEHVVSALRDTWSCVMKDCHFVIFGDKMHALFRHLHVDIRIPRQDLTCVSYLMLRIGWKSPTFRFHHQPSSVPC